ncbi:MAG: c-type cytochrome [Gallionella sp.]|nr:c-type cytochrome [Gallionella sp.]
MQKQLLLIVTLSLLLTGALLTGCDRKEKEVVSPMHTLATTETPKAVETLAPAQTSKQLPQQNGIQLQPVSAAAPDLANLAIGEKVYKSTCSICHKSGLNGAPRMGSKKDWEPRLAQGNEVLYGRALNGYRGSKGSMPSRGSNPRLSEAEVKAAVDYIVAHSIPSWSVE